MGEAPKTMKEPSPGNLNARFILLNPGMLPEAVVDVADVNLKLL